MGVVILNQPVISRALATRGFIVVTPSYRLAASSMVGPACIGCTSTLLISLSVALAVFYGGALGPSLGMVFLYTLAATICLGGLVIFVRRIKRLCPPQANESVVDGRPLVPVEHGPRAGAQRVPYPAQPMDIAAAIAWTFQQLPTVCYIYC